jgi:hypothetical protein
VSAPEVPIVDRPDLVTYLRARLDEDEATASAASPGPWVVKDIGDHEFTSDDDKGWWWVWQESALPYYGGVVQIDHTPGAVGVASITDARQGAKERADAEHIARCDPPAVLADIALRRSILDAYARLADIADETADPDVARAALALATAIEGWAQGRYAARDDFDPSWRTDA